jgi:hypothetical protein
MLAATPYQLGRDKMIRLQLSHSCSSVLVYEKTTRYKLLWCFSFTNRPMVGFDRPLVGGLIEAKTPQEMGGEVSSTCQRCPLIGLAFMGWRLYLGLHSAMGQSTFQERSVSLLYRPFVTRPSGLGGLGHTPI